MGGTWYWNRYPGARCDVESMQYSYEFSDELQQEWDWTERYATQPEILRYAEHVADRFDLRARHPVRHPGRGGHLRRGAADAGRSAPIAGDELTARFVVMATGCLSSANMPDIPGRDTFSGASYHTGRWPHDGVDFTGLRVGVIGTGSSAIQSIPLIAAGGGRAARVPAHRRRTRCRPATARSIPRSERRIKADYAAFRDANRLMPTAFGGRRPDRRAIGARGDRGGAPGRVRGAAGTRAASPFLGAFTDLLIDPAANETAADFVREKIERDRRGPRGRRGADARHGHRLQAPVRRHRLLRDLQPSQRHLVDLRETPIEEITPDGHPHHRGRCASSTRSCSPPASTR